MPLRLCANPTCPEPAVYRGYCREHARERARETHNFKHIYNRKKWHLTRRAKLFNDPLCERCGMIATDVHHRVDLARGGDPWKMDNLSSMCHGCHSQITRARRVV